MRRTAASPPRGFDLHADTAVGVGERDRLERLCRYVLRPPLAGDALELTEDGKVLLRRAVPGATGRMRFGSSRASSWAKKGTGTRPSP
jgi:hypothetical protein